ncbi:MAG: polysulfide reductase NrfD [Verrucomicrobiota bacterium]|nr:polysulfide reductase NrfD [Verrucomicrobiota bacterium]
MSAQLEEPIVASGYNNESVTKKITDVVLTRPLHRGWVFGFAIAFALLMMFFFCIAWLLMKGVGIWGLNIPVAWGFAITNFVWWIGIGHAGTFISAILLLLHQDWRTSINRFAEAMTLFAVACAGLFPLLHLGRPWVFYWLIPYPDTMGLWPQWRSALVWDVFAVSTYLLVSLIFWYIGLMPDVATMRDRATSKPLRIAYGLLALGWRGSARHWKRFHILYLLLGGLATPLVLSVHSVVSLDFAIAIVPGWHSTIFPPYFVAGAIFSGFAMVLTLAIPIRKFYHLEDFVTMRHLENSAKVILVTGLIVAQGYAAEAFISWYSDDKFEIYMSLNRMFGPYAPAYWLLILCNVLTPQTLWFKRIRTNVTALFIISLIVNVGMWTERYVIVITSLHRDFLPSSWGIFHGTRWDWMTLFGSFGLFTTLLFLFLRILPAISISEMRDLVQKKKEGAA